MAAEVGGGIFLPNVVAENDLSTKQFYAVEAGPAGQVDVPDNAGDLVLGILKNKPTAGMGAEVQCTGITKAIAGAAIAYGAKVGTTNAGKMITKSSDADLVCGIALELAAADGDIFMILLTPGAQRAS